jgi:enoyl-CoA hydratase/carnithine racemase
MSTDGSPVEVSSPRPGVRLVTLKRPEALNALDYNMVERLYAVLDELEADAECRTVVLTGAGRAFCAGLDLNGYGDDDDVARRGQSRGMFLRQRRLAGLAERLHNLRQPVIAAVNGAAAGGGLALSLMADIRLGSPTAKFNAAFVRIGLSAGDLGTSWLLPRLIGPAHAADIAYTGRTVGAEEAERLGLLNQVTGADDLLDRTLAMAAQICANSPGGIRLSKRALQANMEISSFAAALELENRGQALLTRCADMPEALAAFRGKRAPNFTGN